MSRTLWVAVFVVSAHAAWGQDARYYEPSQSVRTNPRSTTILEVPPPVQTGNLPPEPFVEPDSRLVPLGQPAARSQPNQRSTFQPTAPQPQPPPFGVIPAAATSPVETPEVATRPTNTYPAAERPFDPPPFNPAVANEPEPAPQPSEEESRIADLVEDSAAATWAKITAVWNYPLTTVDGKAITPGTVLCCLLLLWFGYLASKTISWWFGSRFLPRLGMHQSAVAPVQTITFYVLVATFTMMSLRLANVPLTAFTFLGGAIAIGVGFGSQNVVNNFISGLILLAERPVRVGDVIQVEGFTGSVTQIGPRSTHVTTANNVVIVLPNSKLLEGTVVNWTLSDDRIRTKIVAGVSYGSRTRDVEQLMLTAARKHENVLQDPAPMVVFAEFGDNALQFELHFWIALNSGTNRSEVESDIRFEIDELFRTTGIVMAYPQRDVHLNVLRPVEIRMVEGPSDRNRTRAA